MHGDQDSIPVALEQDGLVSRQAAWGEMTVAFERAPLGMDSRPFFQDLPDGRCPCPHWGYVISGRMWVIYQDHEEIVDAGEAYYLAPGHNVVCLEAGEIIEFSPRDEYQKTMQAVAASMAAQQDRSI